MGEVYIGYDEKLDRKVALKSIRAEHRLDAEVKECRRGCESAGYWLQGAEK